MVNIVNMVKHVSYFLCKFAISDFCQRHTACETSCLYATAKKNN